VSGPGGGAPASVDEATEVLRPLLDEAQRRGFIGPGPVTIHVEHAFQLVPVLPSEGLVADLGSGGGVPVLPLVLACPGVRWACIEANHRRSDWLREATERLGVGDRVAVHEERAELSGRSELRGQASAVLARSFGRPAVTAECAAPLLMPGGMLWVAEPPETLAGRWPEEGLAHVGLEARPRSVASWQGLELVRPCPDRFPRRVGVPAKRPLF
jgi:16S rRNA (guanine527-N7)-methyltransferase